jgi:hypothetical protein
MDLKDRCEVIRDILWEISNLYDLIDWMSMGDSPEEEPLVERNEAAYFIWRSLTAMQIIHMDKLLDEKGKYSIRKIINLAKQNNREISVDSIEDELNVLVYDYNEFEMAYVRDKYIAHRDIVDKEVGINIHRFCIIKNRLISVYNELARILSLEQYAHAHDIANNFKEVIKCHGES